MFEYSMPGDLAQLGQGDERDYGFPTDNVSLLLCVALSRTVSYDG
jgi:hypothetical protein